MITEELDNGFGPNENTFVPTNETNFGETFTATIIELVPKLAGHKKCSVILNNAVGKVVKFCESFPTFEEFTHCKETLTKELIAVFSNLLKIVDPNFNVNELLAFHIQNENHFLFKTACSSRAINLFQFALILQEFCRYLEHFFAMEAFHHLDINLAKTLGESPVFAAFKFQGYNFKFFIKVKLLFEKHCKKYGLETAKQKLEEMNVLSYVEKYFSLQSLFRVINNIPDYFGKKLLFSKIDDYNVFNLTSEQVSEEYEKYSSFHFLCPEKLFERIKKAAKPEVVSLQGLPGILTQPSEKDSLCFVNLVCQNILMNANFQAEFIKCATKNLRLSTFPNMIGKEEETLIYHNNYPLKRLLLLNPKKASFLLLYKLVKEQQNNTFEIEINHLKNSGRFKNYIYEFLKNGFVVDESDLNSHPDEVKRFNRRWNKIFDRAIILIADRFVDLYLAFYFDLAIQKSFSYKFLKAHKQIHKSLFVYPVWKSVLLPEISKIDINFGLFQKYNNIVAEIDKTKNKVTFTFWKGFRFYEEHSLEIESIDFESKTLNLASDESLTGLISDFRPFSVIVVANCKEAYLLRNKVSFYSNFCSGEESKKNNKIDFFIYFFYSPLLESFANFWKDKNWSSSKIYNSYFQNPLLTILSLFTKEIEPKNLFSMSKIDLQQPFNIFCLKLSIVESIFEKNLSVSDLIASPFASLVLNIMGLSLRANEIATWISENKNQLIEGLFERDFSTKKTWTYFYKMQAIDSRLVFFKQAFKHETIYNSLKSELLLMNEDDIKMLSNAVYKIIDSNSSLNSLNEKTLITKLCPNLDLTSSAMLLKQILVEIRAISQRKLSTLMRELTFGNYEHKTIEKIFKDDFPLRNHVIVPMTITQFDHKFIRGRIGSYFSGCLYSEDIGNHVFKNNPTDFVNFFSKNQTVQVIIKGIHPSLLRLDVSMASVDMANLRKYLNDYKILKRYNLEQGINFQVDVKRDFPIVADFEKNQRNFDFFAVENPHLKNVGFAEAKIQLRSQKKDCFLFKPSQRNKNSYFDLAMYFIKLDFVMLVPISLAILNGQFSYEENTHPKKYVFENLEKLQFFWNKSHFDGFTSLLDLLVKPLQTNLNSVFKHEFFTRDPKSAIKTVFESEDEIGNEVRLDSVNFRIRKHAIDDLKFKLYYKDSNHLFGSKIFSVDQTGFTLNSRFETLKELLADFQEKTKSESFLHQTDFLSSESSLCAMNDSLSVVPVITIEEESFISKPNTSERQIKNFQSRDGVRNDVHQNRIDESRNGQIFDFNSGNLQRNQSSFDQKGPSSFRKQERNQHFLNDKDSNRENFAQEEVLRFQKNELPKNTNPEINAWGNNTNRVEEETFPSWGNTPIEQNQTTWETPRAENSKPLQSNQPNNFAQTEKSSSWNEQNQPNEFKGEKRKEFQNWNQDRNPSGQRNDRQSGSFEENGRPFRKYDNIRDSENVNTFRPKFDRRENNQKNSQDWNSKKDFSQNNTEFRAVATNQVDDVQQNAVSSWGNNVSTSNETPNWGTQTNSNNETPSWGTALTEKTTLKTSQESSYQVNVPGEFTSLKQSEENTGWNQSAQQTERLLNPENTPPIFKNEQKIGWGESSMSANQIPSRTNNNEEKEKSGWTTPISGNTLQTEEFGKSNIQNKSEFQGDNSQNNKQRFERPPAQNNRGYGENSYRNRSPNNFSQNNNFQERPRNENRESGNFGPRNGNFERRNQAESFQNRNFSNNNRPPNDRNSQNGGRAFENFGNKQSQNSETPWKNNSQTTEKAESGWGNKNPTTEESIPTWGNNPSNEEMPSWGSNANSVPDIPSFHSETKPPEKKTNSFGNVSFSIDSKHVVATENRNGNTAGSWGDQTASKSQIKSQENDNSANQTPSWGTPSLSLNKSEDLPSWGALKESQGFLPNDISFNEGRTERGSEKNTRSDREISEIAKTLKPNPSSWNDVHSEIPEHLEVVQNSRTDEHFQGKNRNPNVSNDNFSPNRKFDGKSNPNFPRRDNSGFQQNKNISSYSNTNGRENNHFNNRQQNQGHDDFTTRRVNQNQEFISGNRYQRNNFNGESKNRNNHLDLKVQSTNSDQIQTWGNAPTNESDTISWGTNNWNEKTVESVSPWTQSRTESNENPFKQPLLDEKHQQSNQSTEISESKLTEINQLSEHESISVRQELFSESLLPILDSRASKLSNKPNQSDVCHSQEKKTQEEWEPKSMSKQSFDLAGIRMTERADLLVESLPGKRSPEIFESTDVSHKKLSPLKQIKNEMITENDSRDNLEEGEINPETLRETERVK